MEQIKFTLSQGKFSYIMIPRYQSKKISMIYETSGLDNQLCEKIYHNTIAYFMCQTPEYFSDEIKSLTNLEVKSTKNEEPLYIQIQHRNYSFDILLYSDQKLLKIKELYYINEIMKRAFNHLASPHKFVTDLSHKYREELLLLNNSIFIKNPIITETFERDRIVSEVVTNKKSLFKRDYYFQGDLMTNSYLYDDIDYSITSEKSYPYPDINYDQRQNHFFHKSEPKFEMDYAMKAGLNNLGNSCYINAALQILKSLDFLKTGFKASQLALRMKNLFNKMDSNQVVSPREFVDYIWRLNKNWGNGLPQDSKEFLLFILKTLNQEKSSKDIIFTWKMKKTLKYGCGHQNKLDENFILITIAHGNLVEKITTAIKNKIKTSFTHYENFYCSECDPETFCDETRAISSKPKYAIFYRDYNQRSCDYIQSINIIESDIGSLILKGIIILNSIGGSMRHYTAVCCYNDKYYLFDDSRVSLYTNSTVVGGYLYFYEILS